MAVLLGAVVGLGLWDSSVQQGATRDLVANQATMQGYAQARFLTANVKRLQNAYALDIAVGVQKATADNTGDRQLFLAAVANLRQLVAAGAAAALPPDQANAVKSITSSMNEFMAVDDQAIALYRQGTLDAAQQATALLLGRSSSLYEDISRTADSLQAPLAAHQAALSAASRRAANRSNTLLPVAGGVAFLLAFALAALLTRTLVHPLRAAQEVLQGVASGDLRLRVASTSGDEVGQLSLALNQTLERMSETVDGIAVGSETLSSSSEELSAVSQEMSATAEETAAQAATVSAAAEQVSHNLQSVVIGTEELSARSQEIARSSSEAALVAAEGVAAAETTSDLVARLGASSTEIGDVLRVINSIAEQTNLLALNATIEAARAGEAGKGFGVVATEVKDLARKTARSSDEIGRTIETIQVDSKAAVIAISQIASTIHQISDLQAIIAASADEQAKTTREIGQSVRDAALGSSEIARNITGVAEAAEGTTVGAADTHRAAEELAALAGDLLRLVSHFRLADSGPSAMPADDGGTNQESAQAAGRAADVADGSTALSTLVARPARATIRSAPPHTNGAVSGGVGGGHPK